MRSFAIALAATVCLSLPSFAATVQSVQGQVSVNRGAGYQPARSGAPAKPGDVVMASPGGSAQVAYPDGCVVNVSPGAVVKIQASSPCSGAYAQVTEAMDWTPYIVGGVLVAGAVTGVILLTQDKNKPSQSFGPASP